MAGIGGVGVDETRGSIEDTIWYGPHACHVCGATIVKASREDGGAEFDVPERLMLVFRRGSIAGDPEVTYPHTWMPHTHLPQEERPPSVKPAASGGIASSPTWQPIETAPKDRAVLAVLRPHPGRDVGEITFVYWWKGGCWTLDISGEQCDPTHWMPLPPAPVRPVQEKE